MPVEPSPFFTVIIPVYDKGPFVRRAIDSVLGQRYDDLELILVDDASTDDSMVQMRSYTDPRIRILQRTEPGPGGYAARNLGIAESSAEWITFLDADDEWFPNHLEEIKRHIEDDIDIVTCAFKTDAGKTRAVPETAKMDKWTALRRLLLEVNLMNTNTVALRKTVISAGGLFPAGKCRRGGDSDTWLRAILESRNIIASSVVTSLYHIEASGVMSDKKNLNPIHPLVNTIRTLLRDQDFKTHEGDILKKILNRKSILWFLESKKAGQFKITYLGVLYPQVFGMQDVRRLICLFLPKPLLRRLLPR